MFMCLCDGARRVKPLFAILLAGFVAMQNTPAQAETPSGDARAGSKTYNNVCKACHEVSIAPTLRGIIGRPVASVESFANYSEGLKAKRELTWTKENLDTFLTDPAKFAPGTEMVQIIADAQERADLIAFLGILPPPRR